MNLDIFAREKHHQVHAKAIADGLGLQVITSINEITKDYVLVFSFGDLRVINEMKTKGIIFCEHGTGLFYENHHASYAGSTSHRDNVILRLSPNKTHADKEKETLECPVEIIGVPKLDKFAKRYWNFNKEKPTVAISFHFDCFVNPETRSSFNYFKSIIPELNKQFNLIGHAHPRLMPQIQDFYIKNKIRIVNDFEKVLELADVYCCDNSSTIWEWCITEKPVVLFNPPFYRREVEHKGNPRFWRLSCIAPLCNKPEELIDCIWEAVKNHEKYQPIIRQAKKEVLHITDGTATQTACEIIKKYINI
jgi:hypothetical protein